MSTTTRPAREAVILGRLRESYEESGYQFFVRPPAELLPEFLRQFSPDAVALRDDEGIVIEVRSRPDSAAAPKLVALAERIAGAKGWRLDIYSTADFREPVIEPPTPEQLAGQVDEVNALVQAGRLRAALLLGWGTLEAAARLLLPAKTARLSNPPRSVIEALTTFGFITQEAASRLGGLADLRNRAAHGDVNADVNRRDLQPLLEAIGEVQAGIASGAMAPIAD